MIRLDVDDARAAIERAVDGWLSRAEFFASENERDALVQDVVDGLRS